MATNLPPLITSEGLVLNNMMPSEGALGNYTPPGTASSEGISLMLRGMVRAAIATEDQSKKDFCQFLFNAACTYFFHGQQPSDVPNTPWHHSWLVNGGAAFSARGPLQPSGDTALSGYIHKRDPESSISFVAGVGQLVPPPDIIYQAVSNNAEFVWNNVFSELTAGQSYEIDYYIDSAGNKVFGSQKAGSFGQPSVPAGEHQDGAPGKVVLKESLTAWLGINYSVTVPTVKVGYGELFEAWPMWRRLAEEESSTAGDAIHWFLDAFALGKEMDPDNEVWTNAYDRMLEIWILTCEQASNNTRIFEGGSNGPYNNFPLTYSYGYGRNNIDNPDTNWDVVPPSNRYTVERTTDSYVTFTMPAENAVSGSQGAIRYGVAFENKPLYLSYTNASTFSVDMKASVDQTVSMQITSNEGTSFDAAILVGPDSVAQTVGLSQFLQFQQEPGDATGDRTGDWDDDSGGNNPDYPAVPFPGRRLMLIGDSITWYNSYYYPPQANRNDRFAYYSSGMCGYWTVADQLLGGRLEFEHGIQPDIGGQGNGYNVAVAGSKVSEWWEQYINPLNTQVAAGPMYAALNNLDRYDVVMMMGGTNDLAGNDTAELVLRNIKKAATDIASKGKWVFLGVIPPRSRGLLSGYTLAQQDVVRARLTQVNQGLRDWMATVNPPNIFLVDYYNDMLGPNGIDPAGTLSSEVAGGADTTGNFRVDAPKTVFMHDGLHPGAGGAWVMGHALAEVMKAAGVPTRNTSTQLGPLVLGPNLLPNTNFVFTQYPMVEEFDVTGQPISWNYTRIGWATGLGAQQLTGDTPPRHLGFQYGRMPDNWHFYKCTNSEDQVFGPNMGGTFSNFMQYTFESLAGEYPNLWEYMNNSTWPLGAITVSITTDGGLPALRIDVNIPQTGNKNEGFVICAHVPQDQHGPWDAYGYTTPDKGPIRPNSVYNAGDILQAESDVRLLNMNGTMHSYRMLMNFLGINQLDGSTSGAKISSITNSHNFYPAGDLDKIRMHPSDKELKFRCPAVTVPTYASGESRRYAQVKWEFSFDASAGPATATIIIKNPSVRKVIGGTPL